MATSVPVAPVPPGLYCCEGIRGNVNGDPDEQISIADAVVLARYLNGKIETLECIEEADVDGSADKHPVTLEDLDYLIQYIVGAGPPPADCPN